MANLQPNDFIASINWSARLVLQITALSGISKQSFSANTLLLVSLLIIKLSSLLSVNDKPDKLIDIVFDTSKETKYRSIIKNEMNILFY